MTSPSILFDRPGLAPDSDAPPPGPAAFHDLHLDDIVAALTARPGAQHLAPVFARPLPDLNAIAWRQAVFRDLERPELQQAIRAFTSRVETVRAAEERARLAVFRQERERWQLAAREGWCSAVKALSRDLHSIGPAAPALRAIGGHLEGYLASDAFQRLDSDVQRVRAALAAVRYRLHVSGTRIRVSRTDEGEPDYAAEVIAVFERFRHGEGRRLAFDFETSGPMSQVEAQVIRRVERLFPDPFAALTACLATHQSYVQPVIEQLDREARFYLAWLDLAASLAALGLPLTLPEVSRDPATPLEARDGFDLALAIRMDRARRTGIVPNDVDLTGSERILVVSGPNQGGKTTFARMIGQIAWLASLGGPIPARSARLPLVDAVFSHFEREEEVRELSGRLEDELRRIRDILDGATERSLIVMNESFNSTSVADALLLAREVLGQIARRGVRCVFVTFLHELAGDPGVVSMVSTVDPSDPATRTFRILRAPAGGLAHAAAIAARHGLTAAGIRARLADRAEEPGAPP